MEINITNDISKARKFNSFIELMYKIDVLEKNTTFLFSIDIDNKCIIVNNEKYKKQGWLF